MEIRNRNIEKQSCTKRETRIKNKKEKRTKGCRSGQEEKNRKKKSVIDWAQKIKKKKSKRVRHGLPKNVTLQKKTGKRECVSIFDGVFDQINTYSSYTKR
jgi:hypothetical protein